MSSPATENRIVATMLSGDSEAIVEQAIRSVIDWTDLLLLIDTGISDDTSRIARELAGDKLRTVRFEWCNDFAKARNFALQSAAALGATWALTIDTDERLVVGGYQDIAGLRGELTADPAVTAWMVTARDGSYAKERFIRLPTHLEWRGRTHETLVGATALQRKPLPGIQFFEARKTLPEFRQKLQRDLIVLREETRDHPNNARWWFYLGQTLEHLEQYSEAIDAYRRCYGIREGWSEEAAWAAFCAARCLVKREDFEDAVEVCAIGLSRQAASPELAWLAGYCCYRLGRYADATAWEEMAISIGCVEGTSAANSRVGFRHLSGWYEGPYDVLRHVYRQLGQPAKAQACERKYHEVKNSQVPAPAAVARTWSAPRRSGSEETTRVAVLGLYSSGSSAVAGILHHLNVALGREFWGEHYEDQWLAEQLRSWWHEPHLTQQVPRTERVRLLRQWVEQMESDARFVGAKHPLLALCGDDLREAWGEDTKFIWSRRPLGDSITSLQRRGWWPGREVDIQERLWSTVNQFFATQRHLKVHFDDLVTSPEQELAKIVEFLELKPADKELAAALGSIKQRSDPLPSRRAKSASTPSHATVRSASASRSDSTSPA